MNDDKPTPADQVHNPRYEGATPEMVGRALLRHQEPETRGEDQTDNEA